jgi:pilus assembly protein CpaE
MTPSIRTFVAVDRSADLDLVQAALPVDSQYQFVGVIEGLEESWSALQETPCDLLVVACSDYSDRALFLIDGAVKQRPERPVIVLYHGTPNGFVRSAFEAGADDIIALPEPPEAVRFALEKAVARKRGAASTGVATASMICVLGPKGGTGKTLTSCNLAVALAAAGQRTALIDLDLQFGDVGLALGLSPERTIHDLAKSGGSLDAEKLDGFLMTHESGLRVLMAPTRPDHAGSVTVPFLRDVYAILRSSFDYVVVDTPPGFTPEVIASIDSSTHVCMVGMLDSLSLKNTKLGLATLELMGYDQGRVSFVLNRADSRVGITSDDVVAIVGRAPTVAIPSEREIARAINDGTPVVVARSRSEAARAYRSLASTYLPSDKAGSSERRRLLRWKKG